jgi:hypothetical protein
MIQPPYGEYGQKVLISETEFLRVKQRSRLLPSGSHIKEVLLNSDINPPEIIFKTESGTTRGLIWTQKLMLKDLVLALENDTSPLKLRDLIRDSHLGIHCDCPAFLYWGYKYKAWTRGYGMEVETRFPKIRNPLLQGYLCKHLYNVLEVYPFILNTLQMKLKYLLKDTPLLPQG